MDDFAEKTLTPEERAADRAHYARQENISLAASLTSDAIRYGGLGAHGAPAFLREIHDALAALRQPDQPPAPEVAVGRITPAVPVKKSITDDHLVSLIDGSKLQTLSRHLTKHKYTPESYRAAFGLPDNYPMVAAAYSRKRAELAKTIGLGKPKPAAAA